MNNISEKKGRIVVAGGSGFLGEALYKKIQREDSTASVVFLVHNTIPSYVKNSPHTLFVSLKENEDIRGIFQEGDVLFHLAGKTHALSRREYFSVNYEFTKKLVSAARARGARRIIYASTRAITDTHGGYGTSKRAGEEAIIKSGIPYTILRIAEVYGGKSNEGINRFIKDMKRKHIIFYPAGGAPLSPVSVIDVAEALYAAYKNTVAEGHVYTIAGPVSYSMKDLLGILSRAFSRHPLLIPVPLSLISFFIRIGNICGFRGIVFDQISRLQAPKESNVQSAQRDLSFTPTSFEEGVRRLYTGAI